MALITKKKFAEKCGVTMPAITYAIKKKMVIVARDGKRINLSNKQNAQYLKNAKSKLADKVPLASAKTTKKNVSKNKKPNSKNQKTSPVAKKNSKKLSANAGNDEKNESGNESKEGDQLTLFELDRERKLADLEMKEINIQMKQLELRRLSGELIPQKLVQAVFEIFSNSMMESMKASAESFRIKFISQAKLKPEVGAKMQGQLIDMINEGHRDALIQSKAEMVKVFELAKQKNS